MQLVNRYIVRNVGIATLVTTTIVTLVVWLTQALRLVELVLDRGAPVSMLMWMLLLTVPTFLGLILPLALTAAVIFVYYRLMMESELVVMRAGGMSNWQLARPALLMAIVLMLFSYGVTFVVAPDANRELAREQFLIKNDYALVLLRDGMFNRLSDGVTVYVRERIGTNELRGILLHDQSKPDKMSTLFAERGIIEQGNSEGMEGSSKLVLLNGLRQEKDARTGMLSELSFRQYAVDLSQFSADYNVRWKDPRERTLDELIHDDGPDQRPVTLGRLLAELNQRITTPLLAFAFPLLALVALLTAQINRRGLAKRLIVVALAVTLWQVLVMTSASMIPKQPMFIPVLYAVILTPAIGLLLALRIPAFFGPSHRKPEETPAYDNDQVTP